MDDEGWAMTPREAAWKIFKREFSHHTGWKMGGYDRKCLDRFLDAYIAALPVSEDVKALVQRMRDQAGLLVKMDAHSALPQTHQ